MDKYGVQGWILLYIMDTYWLKGWILLYVIATYGVEDTSYTDNFRCFI